MIIVVTTKSFNKQTNRYEILVSHGIDSHTLKNVILPCEPLHLFPGIHFDQALQEYVLPD